MHFIIQYNPFHDYYVTPMMHSKHNNRHYHHHYGGDLGTGGGAFNKVFDMRIPKLGTPFLKDDEIRFGGTLEDFARQFG